MKTIGQAARQVLCRGLILPIAIILPGLAAAAPPAKAPGAKSATSDALAMTTLRRALTAESSGDSAGRAIMLKQALEEAPDFAPAQWQAGRVRVGADWLSIDDAEQLFRGDPLLSEYQRLRRDTPDTAEGHESLAAWCRKHKLDAEARSEWRCVLNFDPQHATAQRALGLHWYNGALLTTAQVTEQKRQAGAYLKAEAQWRVPLARWQHNIAKGDAAQRDEAIKELQSLDDPDAIPLLQTMLSRKSPDNVSPAFGVAVAQTIGKLRDPRANEFLVRLAALSPWAETRQAAAAVLSQHEPIDYVPYALGSLQSPWTIHFEISQPNPNTVLYRQEKFRQSAEFDDYRYLERSFVSPLASRYFGIDYAGKPTAAMEPHEIGEQVVALELAKCMARAVDWAQGNEQITAAENARTEVKNQAICELLKRNFHVDHGADNEAWWSWWKEYNNLYTSGNKPTRTDYEVPGPLMTSLFLSCFAAGTAVSTKTGLAPIESIRPGDLVLAQNPQTGELAYKMVVATTVRPPSGLRQLTVGGEKILTTRGHRFWQEGRGWKMAKELEVGAMLRGIAGPLLLEAAEDADGAHAYNLVVEDFHTYFVGAQRTLVHDNTAPAPVLGPTPGLVEATAKDEP